MLIDTHAHLNCEAYDADRDEAVERSLSSGVWMINVGTDQKSSELAVKIASRYGEGVLAAVALHPQNAVREEFDRQFYRQLIRENKKVVAVGETGLDFGRDERSGLSDEGKNLQKEIFKKHVELAIELNKPLIIHCRKAHEEILEILTSNFQPPASQLRGVAHSFLGNYKQARRYRDLGFKIAFNGIITYARDYDKVIQDTPIEDILIETDCPYLTPAPYRGQRNEPVHVVEVVKKLAEIKKLSYEQVAEQTTKNAREIFGIVSGCLSID